MLYCTKCSSVCNDGAGKCPNCGSHKRLRQANDEDFVHLHRADEYTAQLLAEDFQQAGVEYKVEPFDTGRISYLYDSEVMPTDKSIYVKYRDIEKAKELSAAMKNKMAEEKEEFEEMPAKKRIVIQIVSVVLFLGLITAVVFLADYAAEGIKGFFEGLFNS